MAEVRIPQGGLRKPPPKHAPTPATTTQRHQEWHAVGVTKVWWSKENRYCQRMQVGTALYCITDDYGQLVTVREENPWH